MLVITAVATALDRFELGEFLFPITQDLRFHTSEFADFANGEVAFGRDGRQRLLAGVFKTGFHRRKALLRPSTSDWHGKLRHAVQ